MTTIYVIGDTHFGHAKLLTATQPDGRPVRPFASVEEMDEHMVDRWNATVKPQDHVYHLGDVTLRRENLPIIGRLKGHKRLVRGNHDIYETKEYLKYFKEIHGVRVLAKMILSHIPIHPVSLKQRWYGNVHGHLHNSLPQFGIGPRYYNVSVEMIDYTPVSLEEVKFRLVEHDAETTVIDPEEQ